MPTRIDEYKIAIRKEEILISADSFAPYKLEVAGDVAIKGNTFVHGETGCNKLRGGSLGSSISLQSDIFSLAYSGERYIFISPIVGRIRSAYAILYGSALTEGPVIKFYNYTGIEATTVFTITSYVADIAQSVVFDWTDPDDLAFCSVGIGTSFWAYTASVYSPGTYATVCMILEPIVKGGVYV